MTNLEELVFNDNNVAEIDLSGNPRLKKISAHNNPLLCIDIEAGGADVYNYSFGASLCKRKVDFVNNQFDMATVPGFDMEKAYDWEGGTVSGTVVTLNEGADQVTYMYKCGGFMETEFTLTAKGNELGDTNGDDVVDGRDVVHLMRWLAEETDEETGERITINEKNSDLNGDGTVDEKDLLKLVKKLGGEEDEKPKK